MVLLGGYGGKEGNYGFAATTNRVEGDFGCGDGARKSFGRQRVLNRVDESIRVGSH